ncbi:MAG: dihydroorotate dehydrogenase electron transfer subunit [bacterium]|nr:dihydroorotate dehydrogenase electron transfer subunit [bacterium]
MKDQLCTIDENCHINRDYYVIKIKAPYIADNAKPGNFVMLTVSHGTEHLLKRPFGIFRVQAPYIWLYYQVVGKGTEHIARLKRDDRVRVLGPLGNYFPFEEFENKKILAVAGGRGIAPIYYALENFVKSHEIFLIYGARSKDDLNLLEQLGSLPLKRMFLYTDDGSMGKKGFVTEDIRRIIEEHEIGVTLSCGPDAMFEGLARTIGDLPIDNYVSMEALMGCGFGICYSCAIKMTDDNYKKACSDGPIFNMEEIQW